MFHLQVILQVTDEQGNVVDERGHQLTARHAGQPFKTLPLKLGEFKVPESARRTMNSVHQQLRATAELIQGAS